MNSGAHQYCLLIVRRLSYTDFLLLVTVHVALSGTTTVRGSEDRDGSTLHGQGIVDAQYAHIKRIAPLPQ